MRITRRRFLKNGAAAGAALSLPAPSLRRIVGANDDIRVAVVGFNSRGRSHITGFHRLPGVRVVALCDVDRKVLDREVQRFEKGEVARAEAAAGKGVSFQATKVSGHSDLRRILDDDGIDAVAIATPNHLHALQAIWACQAGKDVYVEKPVSHNVWEGRQLVRAARKYDCIVQCGTQSRSNPGMQQAIEFIRGGGLGDIELVRGLCYKPRPSIGKVGGPTPVPDWIDYDLWCGPAPKLPLMREKLHYDWHWVFTTGNGDLGNQGIHQVDLCRWILGADRLVPSVTSIGGRVGYVDDGDTPNTMITFFDYDTPMIFEVRGLPKAKGAVDQAGRFQMDRYLGASIGVVVHCRDGYLSIPNYAGGVAFDADGNEVKRFRGSGDHFANFIDAVRNRDRSKLNAEIEEGHLSSALCHLGNVSFLLGEVAEPTALRELSGADRWRQDALDRFRAHLAKNDVDLKGTPVRLGRALRLDPETERLVGDEAANALLTREYRAPFVVPAIG